MAQAPERLASLIEELHAATEARKCHRCGCFRGALLQLRTALPSLPDDAQRQIRPAIDTGDSRLAPTEYDCLGCSVCWPANAINLAAEAFPQSPSASGHACATDGPERVPGWPPLPGNFRVLDAAGDVAICVLTSEHLIQPLIEARARRLAIIGSVYTENLGLERMIINVLANPNITALLVCGADSLQRIGHLPGQSLLSLVANGLDERGRIIGAQGRRPVLKNVGRDAVDAFRSEIAVLDRIGTEDISSIQHAISDLPPRGTRRAARRLDPGHGTILAEAPMGLELDPRGYFVVLPDRARRRIVVEHYTNDGVLSHVIDGERASDLVSTVVARELVSRLDHAAYLGKELALAEHALKTGEAYVQDAAPESLCTTTCECRTELRPPGGKAP